MARSAFGRGSDQVIFSILHAWGSNKHKESVHHGPCLCWPPVRRVRLQGAHVGLQGKELSLHPGRSSYASASQLSCRIRMG